MEIVPPRLKYSLEHILEIRDLIEECDVQPVMLSMFSSINIFKKCFFSCEMKEPALKKNNAKIITVNVDKCSPINIESLKHSDCIDKEGQNENEADKEPYVLISNNLKMPSNEPILNQELAKETEKNITFEEFIRKLKEKDSLTSVETDPEQNIGRFPTHNFDKTTYYPGTRSMENPSLVEPFLMIDPKCPVHSVQSKNSALSFMPSSVAKKLSIKGSTESEKFVDPWQKMRSQTRVQLFESQPNKPPHCHHQFQNRVGPCDRYRGQSEMGHSINQDHEYVENRTDEHSSIDPKVLMILKKLGQTNFHDGPPRCNNLSNSKDYFFNQPNNFVDDRTAGDQHSNHAYNYG